PPPPLTPPLCPYTTLFRSKTMTWYVPGRNAGDDGSAGALWMSMQPGTGKAVIGGYESRDTTFGRDPATGKPTVSGQGSQVIITRSEEHTSELQSRENLVCR